MDELVPTLIEIFGEENVLVLDSHKTALQQLEEFMKRQRKKEEANEKLP